LFKKFGTQHILSLFDFISRSASRH